MENSEILKMNTPGVGNKKRQFKKLLGWGKDNERATLKQLTKKRTKLSRKLRSGRTKRSKDNRKSNPTRRKLR